MDESNWMKEVHFSEYCPKCVYKETKEDEDPCFECLQEPARQYSHKPLKFMEKAKYPGGKKK